MLIKHCHRCGEPMELDEKSVGEMACPPCAQVIREELRRAASVIPEGMCHKCWNSFGKALWVGSCICTGHVNPIFTMPGNLSVCAPANPTPIRAAGSVRDKKPTKAKATIKPQDTFL